MTPAASVEIIPGIEQSYPVIKGQLGEFQVTVWGRPYISTSRLTEVPRTTSLGQLVKKLDGEWLLTGDSDEQFVVANDRFASIPLFYALAKTDLIFSTQYLPIWKELLKRHELEVQQEAFFEFLHFQRLFGETTFDKSTKVLAPGSIITFDKSDLKLRSERYWTPSRSNKYTNTKDSAEALASAFKKSVELKTEGIEKTGLLLSGGLDSRVILGALQGISGVTAFTVGSTRNNEVQVAESLANTAGVTFEFVQRPEDQYANALLGSSAVSGGMFSFQHAHFGQLDFGESEQILHGHGLDYFFQGMYIPSTRRKILGKVTAMYALAPVSDSDLSDQYTIDAKYRLKGASASSFIKTTSMDRVHSKVSSDIEDLLQEFDEDDALEAWDLLTTHAPSRHYTYLNLLSIAPGHQQTTVAFDNEVLDIYLGTPAQVRHGTSLLVETIRQLDPRLLAIRNANTNHSPALSPFGLTLSIWLRGLKRRLGMSVDSAPEQADRSWPSTADILRGSDVFKRRLRSLPTSERLQALEIFNIDAISAAVNQFESGDSNMSGALLTFLTMDRFLEEAGTP